MISEARKRKSDLFMPEPDEEPLAKVFVPEKRNGVTYIPTAFVAETRAETEEGEIASADSDTKLNQQESIPTELKTILTARLENCLIDLGSPRQNLQLCLEMFKMGSHLGLSDLAAISKQAVLKFLDSETVFSVLQVRGEHFLLNCLRMFSIISHSKR